MKNITLREMGAKKKCCWEAATVHRPSGEVEKCSTRRRDESVVSKWQTNNLDPTELGCNWDPKNLCLQRN